MNFVVYNPTSEPTADKMGMAPRIENLQDGVLGVIDNGKTLKMEGNGVFFFFDEFSTNAQLHCCTKYLRQAR